MTDNFKLAPVQRTPYHRVVLSYYVDSNELIWVQKIIPDIGAVPKLTAIDVGPHKTLAAARKAVRKAMSDKEALCLNFIELAPRNWIQFVLGLDSWLYESGRSFDDLDLDKMDVTLKVRCTFPTESQPARIDRLYGTVAHNDAEFEFEFGVIDWEKFALIN